MLRAVILAMLILCWGPGSAQNKPESSLTLIPPSPVTEQIDLDIRAGIWNNSNLPRTFTASFFLDDEKKETALYQQVVTIKKQSSAGIKFRWPTKGRVGEHKIILVCRNGKNISRTERSIQILASDIRSTRKIDGAFMGFYHWSETEGRLWNADIKKMTDDQWRELVNAQHELEMNIIVMQEVFRNQEYEGKQHIDKEGYKGRAYYPSALFAARMPIAAHDPVEAVLSQADKNGMQVFVAVGLYAWFDFTEGSLKWHKKVAAELWRKYGHHPSFYGWYVSEEMDGGLGDSLQRRDIVAFFQSFTKYVHGLTPDKPVMLATNSNNLRGAEATYAKLLPNLDILCTFGFHRMPKGDLTGEDAAHLLQKLCNHASTHFWMDMEVFDFAPDNALMPRPVKGLLSDLQRFPDFEKIICYQFPGLLNSPAMSIQPGGEKTVELFLDYKKYLNDRLPAVK
jgi:Domain of unknown function (DUF4434)